jgi:hypothetical protein
MSQLTTIPKSGLKISVIESLYNEILTNASNYYYFLGQTLAWSNADEAEEPQNTAVYESQTRNEIIFLKRITSADVSFVIPRRDWQANIVYDKYDDFVGGYVTTSGCTAGVGTTTISAAAGFDLSKIGMGFLVEGDGVAVGCRVSGFVSETQMLVTTPHTGAVNGTLKFRNVASSGATSLEDSSFFVMTQDFHVYKCLDNNYGAPSTVMPFGTTFENLIFPDGYVWKYMYTVPRSLISRFTTQSDIPVLTAIKNQYYSRGSLTSATVLARGSGYGPETQVFVVGDGYLVDNVFRLLAVEINNTGFGYTAVPTIGFSDPYSSDPFVAEESLVTGQYIKTTANKIYEVLVGGITGEDEPTHTSEEAVYNGTVGLRFVGLTASGVGQLVSGQVQSVNLSGIVGYINVTQPGAGYTSSPTLLITSTSGSGAEAYAAVVNGRVGGITITNRGEDYADAVVSFSPPYSDANSTAWSNGLVVALNDVIRHNGNYYSVDSKVNPLDTTLTLGSNSPTHVSGTEVNGDVVLRFIGQTAAGNVEIFYGYGYSTTPNITVTRNPLDSVVTSVDIVSGGSGYSTPTITFSTPNLPGGVRARGRAVVVGGQISAVIIDVAGSGYSTPPTITVTGAGAGFTYDVNISNEVTLDGTVLSVNVNNGGSGYVNPVVTFDPPPLGGTQAEGVAVVSGGVITSITITKSGSGYVSTIPFCTITASAGQGFVGSTVMNTTAVISSITRKTEALFAPVIENGQLVNVISVNPGEGYSTATLFIVGNGEGAEVQLNTAFGDLNTRQASVELLAIPGTIDSIQMLSQGYGYIQDLVNVEIIGDGEGAQATATVEDGRITRITVTNPGTKYTKASVVITGNVDPEDQIATAHARPIISPAEGHGKNAVRELYAKDITFFASVSTDKNQGFSVINDYRQIGIIKNPQTFDLFNNPTNVTYAGRSGTCCYSITGDFVYDDIDIDMIITNAAGNQFRVVAKPPEDTGDTVSLLVQSLDNAIMSIGDVITYREEGQEKATISRVTPPTVNKYSGDLLFIDNRGAFQPSQEQTISLKTALSF